MRDSQADRGRLRHLFPDIEPVTLEDGLRSHGGLARGNPLNAGTRPAPMPSKNATDLTKDDEPPLADRLWPAKLGPERGVTVGSAPGAVGQRRAVDRGTMLRDTARTSEVGRHNYPGVTAVGTRSGAPTGGWTVAHVDLTPSPAGQRAILAPGTDPAWNTLFGKALETIEQTVRANDRVCPYGVSRIAIAFGPDVRAVAPRRLGERLARAIGRGLDGDLPSSPAAPRRVERNPARCGGQRGPRPIDRLLPQREHPLHHPDHRGPIGRARTEDGRVVALILASPGHLGRFAATAASPHGHPLLHRPCHRLRNPPRRPRHLHDAAPRGAVLVVDPDPAAAGSPGIAALATCTSAERLGFRARAVSQSHGGDLVAAVDGMALDLVVLMVGAESTTVSPSWSSSTWCTSAQLTAAYRAAGIEVLAVGVGAGAGALAGCLEQGASVLFDVNAVADELLELESSRHRRQRPDHQLPPGRPTRTPPGPHPVDLQRAPGALLPDHRWIGPGDRRRDRGLVGHGAVPHPLGPAEAGSPLAAGSRRPGQPPGAHPPRAGPGRLGPLRSAHPGFDQARPTGRPLRRLQVRRACTLRRPANRQVHSRVRFPSVWG